MKSSINYKLKVLDRDIKVIYTDSTEHDMIKKHWLSGELINMIWEKAI